MKTCKKCGSTEFYKNKHKYAACKKCQAAAYLVAKNADPEKFLAAGRKWKAENKEKVSASGALYREKNKEKTRARQAKYRAENAEKIKAYNVAYIDKNIKRILEVCKVYREANRSKVARANALWASNNPDTRRKNKLNRRARIAGAKGVLSAGLAETLYAAQGGVCACGCGVPLEYGYHMDHNMPIALGGANEDWNMQLLTPACNLSKGSKHPDVWIELLTTKGLK